MSRNDIAVRLYAFAFLAAVVAVVTASNVPSAEPGRDGASGAPSSFAGSLPSPCTFVNSICMKMVYIKSGSFLMGSPDSEKDRNGDEGPQHRVRITKGFHISVCEVTQEQYQKMMGKDPSHFKKGGNWPVEQVSWPDATEFCRKLSAREMRIFRLPTEAEWEYACRARSKSRFCFGDLDRQLGIYAWYKSNSGRSTHPVGRKRRNAWGLHDVHGNVWEWCQDWYASDYYARSPEDNPRGPDSGILRVIRGGSWASGPGQCRSASRHAHPSQVGTCTIGFRVLCESSCVSK